MQIRCIFFLKENLAWVLGKWFLENLNSRWFIVQNFFEKIFCMEFRIRMISAISSREKSFFGKEFCETIFLVKKFSEFFFSILFWRSNSLERIFPTRNMCLQKFPAWQQLALTVESENTWIHKSPSHNFERIYKATQKRLDYYFFLDRKRHFLRQLQSLKYILSSSFFFFLSFF